MRHSGIAAYRRSAVLGDRGVLNGQDGKGEKSFSALQSFPCPLLLVRMFLFSFCCVFLLEAYPGVDVTLYGLLPFLYFFVNVFPFLFLYFLLFPFFLLSSYSSPSLPSRRFAQLLNKPSYLSDKLILPPLNPSLLPQILNSHLSLADFR